MLLAMGSLMSTKHAAVWLDHEQAKIFHVHPETAETADLHIAHHLHHPNKTGGHAELHRDVAELHPFFDDIAKHLADAEEILVLGPADTKLAFVTFAKERYRDLAPKIVGVEASDHPTDGQIVAHVRKFFLAADRMRS
jgi:stalled ribosome rescue protein Dom34